MSRPRRGGLGRGLGALIPTGVREVAESDVSRDSAPEPPRSHLYAISDPSGDVAPPDDVSPDTRPSGSAVPDQPGHHRAPSVSEPGGDTAPRGADPAPAAQSVGMGQGSSTDGPADADTPIDDGTDPGNSVRADGDPGTDGDPAPLRVVPGVEYREIEIERIRPNQRQPRTAFDEEALTELAHSITAFGVLQPVVVRPVTDGFELVMGERRLRAAAAAGLTAVPAIIRDTADEAMLRDALLENIHRAQLNPLEEAAAYQQLLEEFGVTHEELAGRIGRSRSHVTNTVRLMNLSLPVQRRVAAGVLSAGHARALLALADADAQDDLAARIVAEGLSVRATEELVSLAAKGLLGGTGGRRRALHRPAAPAAAELAERLSDTFDTRVRVDIGQRKGKITIEFASIADLERIVMVMAPTVATSVRAEVQDGSEPGVATEPAHPVEP